MRNYPILFVALCLFTVAHAQEHWIKRLIEPSNKFEVVQKAGQLVKKGKSRTALQFLQKLCKQNAELPPAEFLLGIMYIEVKKGKAARRIFENVAVNHPLYPGAYIILGNIALNAGRYTEASLLYEKAMELTLGGKWKQYQKDAFSDQCYSGLAVIAERRKKWSELAAYFEKLMKLRKDGGLLRQRYAIAKFRSGITISVYKMLKQAKEENDKLAEPEVTMAQLYTEKGERGEAGKWMRKALSRNPKDPGLRYQVAQWFWKNGKMEEAEKYALDAKKFGFDKVGVDILLGMVAQEKKDYAEAEKIFAKIHQESPTNFTAGNQLALVLIEQKDPDKKKKALQLAKIQAKLRPKDVNALTTLGWVYFRLNAFDQAEKFLKAAVSTGKTTAETAYYMARLMFKKNKLSQTKKWLQLAKRGSDNFIYKDEVEKWLDQINKAPE